MRKAFAKRFAAVLLALFMLAALPVATAFAADDTGYVVTFRAGEHGAFTQDYVDGLVAKYGAEDVYCNATNTVVAVLVMDDETAPDAPVPNATLTAEAGSNYTVTTAVDAGTDYVAGDPMTADYDFVAQYALKGDRGEGSYLVRYLLQDTEEEVAPSMRGTAVVGLPLTLTAIAVDEYNAVGETTLTLEIQPDGQTVFTFYYTPVVHVYTSTEYVTGDTVVNYNDINLVGGAGVVGGGEGGEEIADDETPQAGGEDIVDDETPQAGGDETPGGEDIEDDETPQAGADEASTGISMPMVVGGVAILLLIALLVLLALRKRKSGEGEE